MTDENLELARNALGAIPVFSNMDAESVTIERLGGLTNLVFRVNTADGPYCLRLPGQGTEEYINRENEAQAAHAAASAGVSPAVLYSDPQGVMVTEYIEGAITMTPDSFKSRLQSPKRAGEAFRKLHDANLKFNFRFELFSMIDEYLEILAAKTVDFPEGYHEVLEESRSVREALNKHDIPITACHCDPLCENFLDTGEKMWIVDWEYSGMNDPMWDLGDLSVEAGFDQEQDKEMIEAYFGEQPRPDQYGRIIIYKAMCDLLWTLWGLIQHANNNPVEDFWAYSTTRFSRCKALMETNEFSGHVKAVYAGPKT